MKLIRRDPELGYLDSLLWVPKRHINIDGTKAALTFTVDDKRSIRFLNLYQETQHHLLVPREFWAAKDVPVPVVDVRPKSYPKVNIKSRITLDFKDPTKTIQRDAVRAMEMARGGILQLACGLGKTVCALELIARERVPAIIIVDNTHLFGQWTEAIHQFLEIEGGLGMIGDGQFDWKRPVVISTYQTLSQKWAEFPQEARHWFGLIIWDEAHHMAAPTWARTADLFYGKRIGLTATPERADGTHVIYDFHLGPVLYKNLIQELKPSIYFYWTGLSVDENDPKVKEKVCDVNGELHTSMLSSYFGQWRPRLDLILDEVKKAEAQGRKILVLSYSLAELINMFCLWSGYPHLYTDMTFPTAAEVGETITPYPLDEKTIAKLTKKRGQLMAMLKDPGLQGSNATNVRQMLLGIQQSFAAHEVWKKCEAEQNRRQVTFLRKVLEANGSNAGIMIGAIKPEVRQKMLREKQVVFAIMKYGREGLDEQALDTVFVCEPMSQKNSLQQLMGRVLRKKAGKKTPVVVFFEDDIGPMIGMCQNLRGHLRSWPLEEGGPFRYELVGHPRKGSGNHGSRYD